MAKPITEMDIDELLYAFQERMQILIKREAGKWQPHQHFFLDEIENELMPIVDHMVDYDPTHDYIDNAGEPSGVSGYVKEAALLTLQERMRGL